MLKRQRLRSGDTYLTPPHCSVRYILTELRYAAILPISALSHSARNAQASRSVSKYRRFPFGKQIASLSHRHRISRSAHGGS
jgi:hypothetical protein